MKRWIALALVCLLCTPVACAAQWAEGLSAAQPYSGVPAADLTQSMGYVLMFPTAQLPAKGYCDVLDIYLPREDIELGAGAMTLLDENGEVAEIDFSDYERVAVRPLTDSELAGLRWGGGVCVEARLPVSLDFDTAHHVHMDEGCFTAANGSVKSVAITADDAWTPTLSGDYGVGGLRYTAGDGDEAETVEQPKPGDRVRFRLALGGEAVSAGLYSPNGSVTFEKAEYNTAGTVVGEVTGADVRWGVAFFNAEGDIIETFDFAK